MTYFTPDNLYDLMLEKNLTTSDLSRLVKMQYKSISNYLKNIYAPSLKNAIKLANFFHCDLDYLAGLAQSKKEASYSNPDFKFYERYNKVLKEQNVTHYRLCKDTGITINDSHKWKLGAIPTFSNLIKISDYLDVSIDYLIGRNPIKN